MIPALSFIFRSLHLPYKPLELSPRFLFFHYCYFYWNTQRKPLRRRQSGDGGSKWWAPVYFPFFQANRRYQGETLPGELSVLLCSCIAHVRQGSGESGIDWPVKRAPVHLPIRIKGNLKRTSGYYLSPSGAQNNSRRCFADVTIQGYITSADAA